MTSLADLSAVEARALIGRKQLSPIELLEACIERYQAVNETVNAIVAVDLDRARAEAKRAEAAVMSGDALPALHGLPIGVKDNTRTAGLRTTFGSPIYRDFVPEKDDLVVQRLRRAGAIVLGKTNVPEFSLGANTVNEVYGATRNPFDPALIAGGSSGGSAAALATGMTPLCTGTDSGGSLRIPASFCGVFALRPTPGLVPAETRPIGLTTYNTQGPLARTVADAGLMLSAIAGHHGLDPMSAPVDAAAFHPAPQADLSSLRVAYSEDLGFAPIDDRIRATFRDRIARFRSAFRRCDDTAPDVKTAYKAFWLLRGPYFLADHAERMKTHAPLLGKNFRSNYEAAARMTANEIAWAHAEQTRLMQTMHRFFEDYDLVVTPAISVPPFAVERLFCDEINGVKYSNYTEWMAISSGVSVLGLPTASLPCGLGPAMTPFGLQLIGRHRADLFVLAVAHSLETLFAGDSVMRRPIPAISADRSRGS